jgi:hypothetical protein
MAQRLSEATNADYEELLQVLRQMDCWDCAQETAQRFVDIVYGRFSSSLVLLRLFITLRYDRLTLEARLFVDGRGRDTNTSRLIHGATPIFTLLGTRGLRPEWNDRRAASHFRCIPLSSTAFVASLSMLSRQFESVGSELDVIDEWDKKITAAGWADVYSGMLRIRDSAADRDLQGRLIVPKQEFVVENGVKTTLGFGSGYAGHPTLVTLFAFTNEYLEVVTVRPMMTLLIVCVNATEEVIRQGRVFTEYTFPHKARMSAYSC